MLGLGVRGLGFKGSDREGREDLRAEGKPFTPEEEKSRVGRQRGMFAFAISGEDMISHSPFYSAATDPWTMSLERAPPIPEPAK